MPPRPRLSSLPLPAALIVPLTLTPALCAAQPPAPVPPVPPAPDSAASARTRRGETLKQITDRLSAAAGARVLADSALGPRTVLAPDGAVTAENLEAYLTRLALRLPPGSAWFTLYLPAAESRRYPPDRIADMARAQVALFDRPTPGMIQIQGRSLSAADAQPVLRTLGLEPVYILTSRVAPGRAGALAMPPTGAGSSSQIMDSLAKQLGVAAVEDIPTGTYKVSLPGADGVAREATVEVENTDGNRRIRIRMGSSETGR